MLFDMLQAAFPALSIIPNDKTLLDGLEVDISIPELKVGIEWNGIVHYEPIYGVQKLAKIRSLDARKQQNAVERGVLLIIVPDLVSTSAKVKEAFESISATLSILQTEGGGVEPPTPLSECSGFQDRRTYPCTNPSS